MSVFIFLFQTEYSDSKKINNNILFLACLNQQHIINNL